MNGKKTIVVAGGIAALINLLTAFGVPISEEQKAAIMEFMAELGWPLVMIAMRFFTKEPVSLPWQPKEEKEE